MDQERLQDLRTRQFFDDAYELVETINGDREDIPEIAEFLRVFAECVVGDALSKEIAIVVDGIASPAAQRATEKRADIPLNAPFGPATVAQRYTVLQAFAKTEAYRMREEDDRDAEAGIDYLDLQAGQHGLKFVAGEDGQYRLEVMTIEERAAFRVVRQHAKEIVAKVLSDFHKNEEK